MRQNWWKILAVILITFSLLAGLSITVPQLDSGNLDNTIRNLFYHVPMWFNMVFLYTLSFYYSLKYLLKGDFENDIKATEYAQVGLFFSVLGMITGMEWANFTWMDMNGQRTPWTEDPKQICAALCMLIYFAYFILRQGIKDDQKKGRISAVYNIFAYILMFPLIFVIPRMVDSLHPGSGGNPGFNAYDLDNHLRLVFYPSVFGWILLSLWISSLFIRINILKYKKSYLS